MHKYRADTITVNNNFAQSDKLAIVRAITAGSISSIAVFDARKRLIHYNNRFGTLDGAGPDDLLDLYTLFGYYSNFYSNWLEVMETFKQVFNDCIPREVSMHHINGWSCSCKAWPIMEGGRLGGVVLLAYREDGSKLQGGGRQREQLNASRTN